MKNVAKILLLLTLTASPQLIAQMRDTSMVGTWRLISIQDPADSTRYHPGFGPRPTGVLVYSPSGTVAIQLMSDPRPSIAATGRDNMTGEDALRSMRAYYAYFGRYTVQDGAPWGLTGRVLVQQVESSVWPFEVGREYVRLYSRSGDTLTLRASQAGGWAIQRWQRVSP